MVKISVLCPTRARPALAARLWKSVMETASSPDEIEIMVYLDQDDPETGGYQHEIDAFRAACRSELFALVGKPSGGAVYAINSLAMRMKGEIAVAFGDDVIVETPGWDKILTERVARFKDNVYLAWFADGNRNAELALHPAVSRDVILGLGYFACPLFRHLYSDVYATELFRSIGRDVFIGEVIARHYNPEYGDREEDMTDLQAKSEFQLDRMMSQKVAPRLISQDRLVLQEMIRTASGG